jgi:hypothetical protein
MTMKSKLVYGVGINDADYAVRQTINGKRTVCPAYLKWANMLGRCYNESALRHRPKYRECSVSEEWHTFSNFKSWYDEQGDVTGKQLDKDIIYPGNKVYAPDKCVFVDSELNNLLCKSDSTRGKYPIGVSVKNDRKKKYIAQIFIHSTLTFLGYYYTPEEAHNAYVEAKVKYIQDYYLSKETDSRIIDGLNRWIEVLRKGEYDLV